jgi:hypothetical protein
MSPPLQSTLSPSAQAPDASAKLVYAVERWETFGPDLPAIIYQHWREVALDIQDIPLDMNYARYAELDALDMLHIVTVRIRGNLIGYFVAFVMGHMHYQSTLHAMVDLYYILPHFRRGTTALKLFGVAHRTLKARGVVKIASATKLHSGLDMSRLFEYMDYRLTEKAYTRLL